MPADKSGTPVGLLFIRSSMVAFSSSVCSLPSGVADLSGWAPQRSYSARSYLVLLFLAFEQLLVLSHRGRVHVLQFPPDPHLSPRKPLRVVVDVSPDPRDLLLELQDLLLRESTLVPTLPFLMSFPSSIPSAQRFKSMMKFIGWCVCMQFAW
jgi:hypothetical protein